LVRTILLATFLAFGILIVGQGMWGGLLALNLKTGLSIPWCVPAMALLLFALWQYLAGKGWPQSTSAVRASLLRARPVSGKIFWLAFLAGVLSIAAFSAYWIILSQLVRVAPNALPKLSAYPIYTLVLVGIMASLVAPLVEEAGFRGYCQTLLERRFTAPVAVGISSVLFMLAHLTQGAFATKLFVYLVVGVVLGTLAYLTNSILPGIAVHIVADVTFFAAVWPFDAKRTLVWNGGADMWFWLHVAQAIVFTLLGILAFQLLARQSAPRAVRFVR
jgi:membrane protease YdiL (CAAX protease family)